MSSRKVLRPAGTSSSKQKNGIYVYATSQKKYLSDRKYNINKRVCIGKMIDDQYMEPNDRFSEFFPDIDIDEQGNEPKICDTVKAGTTFLIDHIFETKQIGKLLENIFIDASKYIQDLVSYMLVSEDSVMQYYDSYAFDHRIIGDKVISDSTIGRLIKEIDTEDVEMFLRAWNQMNRNAGAVYISYDSTNINTEAKGIEMAEYGHAKEDDDKPVVNLAAGYDQDRSVPLFYETYPGSIIDNTQCDVMVEKAKEYGYKDVGFVLDRGYFSAGNIKHLTKAGYEFILMAKGNARFVKEAMDEVRLQIRLTMKYYLPSQEVYGTTVKRKLFGEDKTRYFHVYYDDARAARERSSYLTKLKKMDETLERKVQKKLSRKEELRSFEKHYTLKFDDNGYLLSYKRKENVIQKEIDKLGYFVLITSEKMSAEKALEKYRGRDVIEKLFRTIKSMLGMDTLRVHDTEAMEGKCFLAFISAIVWNEMFQALKDLKRDENDRKHYTVPAAIREMEKIFITRNSNGVYVKRYALTARQKKILKAFGLEERHLNSYIRTISRALKARTDV